MKAKLIKDYLNEKFIKESDPIEDMGIGHSKRTLNSKSFKILLFIESKGKEGASLKEIQYFIWTKLDGYSHKSFYERSSDSWDWETNNRRKGQRKTRGHWNTQLFGGSHYHEGLLHKYCEQNPETNKWVLRDLPLPQENMYNWKK